MNERDRKRKDENNEIDDLKDESWQKRMFLFFGSNRSKPEFFWKIVFAENHGDSWNIENLEKKKSTTL